MPTADESSHSLGAFESADRAKQASNLSHRFGYPERRRELLVPKIMAVGLGTLKSARNGNDF
jgi:hypothetical protein